jgi:hypothetical protein
MTRSEAVEVRCKQLRGEPVKALDLQEAIRTLSKRRDSRVKLPAMSEVARERINAILLWNLGRSLARPA